MKTVWGLAMYTNVCTSVQQIFFLDLSLMNYLY